MNAQDERTQSLWMAELPLAPNAKRLSKDATCVVNLASATSPRNSEAVLISYCASSVASRDGNQVKSANALLASVHPDSIRSHGPGV